MPDAARKSARATWNLCGLQRNWAAV